MGNIIAIEGIDGAGKTTLVQSLKDSWSGYFSCSLEVSKAPGGVETTRELRDILFKERRTPLNEKTKFAIFLADRVEQIEMQCRPTKAEERKSLVLDRFNLSTIAYQSVLTSLSVESIKTALEIFSGGFEPDLTIYLDVSVEVAIQRIQKRGNGNNMDYLESLGLIRECYLNLIEENPKKLKKVNANQPPEAVLAAVINVIKKELPESLPV